MTESKAEASGVPTGVSVAWLSAGPDAGYAVLSCYDAERKWSSSAVYNAARLLKAHPVPTAA